MCSRVHACIMNEKGSSSSETSSLAGQREREREKEKEKERGMGTSGAGRQFLQWKERRRWVVALWICGQSPVEKQITWLTIGRERERERQRER